MTDWANWFASQLRASTDGFAWAFSQIPESYRDQQPPGSNYLGTWSPNRLVWHVTEYEKCLAIPNMLLWVNGGPVPQVSWPDDDETWAQVQDRSLDTLVGRFLEVRQQQIDLVEELRSVDWDRQRDTIWGSRPLSWVVTKSYQHTYEHGDTLLRMGLWWESILERIAESNQ